MSQHVPLMIPQARAGVKPLEVRAPYDGRMIATADTADHAVVDRALDIASELFRVRDAWLSPADRIAILHRTATLMAARAEELALEAAREGGKPLLDSRVEVQRAIDGVRSCVELLRTEAGREIPMNINAACLGAQ